MYLKLKNIRLEKTKYGNDLVVKQVELRNSDGKFISHPKIDEELKRVVHNGKIVLNE
jgi:hypothetical protein